MAESSAAALQMDKKRPATPVKKPTALLLIVLSAMALVVYFVSLRFLMPGYFAPLVPFHSDFYLYTGMAGEPWPAVLRYPRFVTYSLFKLFGTWDVPPLMAAGIAVALADVMLVLSFTARVWPVSRRTSLIGATLYFAVLFTHPQFYFEHRHDMPAMFSLLFLMLALHAWLAWLKRSSILALLASLACVVAFGFTKESFFVSAIVLTVPLLVLYPSERRQTAAFLTFCIGVEIVSMLHSRSFSSPFLDPTAAATSSYYIDARIPSILRVLAIYLHHLFLWPALIILALALAQTVRSRLEAIVTACWLAAGLAALGPISLLPNHVFAEYAWLAAPFLFAPVSGLVVPRTGPGLRMAGVALVVLVLIAYEVTALRVFRHNVQWFVEQEITGGNLWRSLRTVDTATAHSKRILVTGLETPFPPWTSDAYVRWRFGERRFWFLVYPHGELRAMSSRRVWFSTPSQVDLPQADAALIYDAAGRLSQVLSAEQLHQRFRSPVDLVPELVALHLGGAGQISDPRELVRSGDSLMQWSFAKDALAYYQRAALLTGRKDAGVLLRLARAEGQAGDFTHAMDDIRAAIANSPPAEAAAYRHELEEMGAQARAQAAAAPALEIRLPAAITEDHSGLVVVSLVWKAPAGTAVEVHVNSCDGPLVSSSVGPGTTVTGKWVHDGQMFYLQDVSGGKELTPRNTLAETMAAGVPH